MFKKIKENEKVIKIKELWNNPRSHDIMVLIFWLLFIFFVIIFVRSMGSSTSAPKEAKIINDFNSMKSYEFTYKTNDNVINGEYYNGGILFYLDNKKYYFNNNVYLIDDKVNSINYDLGVLKIDSKFLSSLTSGITASDNKTFKQYIVPLDRFISLYEIDTDADLSKAVSLNVIVSVYLNNNEINKVVLDLSNYYSFKGNNITYPVTIYYYNVNNVSDFRKGYDKMLEVM